MSRFFSGVLACSVLTGVMACSAENSDYDVGSVSARLEQIPTVQWEALSSPFLGAGISDDVAIVEIPDPPARAEATEIRHVESIERSEFSQEHADFFRKLQAQGKGDEK